MAQGGRWLDIGQMNEQMGIQHTLADELTDSPHWLHVDFGH